MFTFFSKKNFIVDFLEGMTDIHCHILPAIDDGSKDEEMSLEMLGMYLNLGYTGLVATPHIMKGFYENSSTSITHSLEKFRELLDKNNFQDFKVGAAAEYMLDEGFDPLTNRKDLLPISQNKVLVEMSYLQKAIYVESQLFELRKQGFEPVMAHPERYPYLTNIEEVQRFKDLGCYLQLNLLALGNHYGSHATKQAQDLLANNKYDFLATDAHHPGHLNILKKITISKKLVPHFEALANNTKESILL